MNAFRPKISRASLLATMTLSVAACGGDALFQPATENEDFAPELGIDLDAMTLTASGLYFEDLTVGEGEQAAPGDFVEVGFVGWLANGMQFDSGSFRYTVGSVGPGGVIAGFDEGVTDMRPGGIRRLVIPPELAFGSAGTGVIPPNATLIFLVELLDIL